MRIQRLFPLFIVIGLSFLSLSLAGCFGDSKTKDEYFKKGMSYLKEDNENAAIIEFRNAIKKDPKYPDPRYQLGLIYLKKGDAQKAYQQLVRAVSLDPENLDAKLKVAELLLLGKKLKESRQYVEELLKKAPDNANALALVATIEMIEGHNDKALENVDKAIGIIPDNARFYGLKGRVLLQMGKTGEAEVAFLKALETGGNKAIHFKQLIGFYIANKQMEKAEAKIREMISVFPDDPEPYLLLANFYMRTGQNDLTEENLKKAMEVAPDDEKVNLVAADFYDFTGKYETAEEIYLKGFKKPDVSDEFKIKLADFYFKRNRFKESQDIMDGVLAKNPDNAGANLLKTRFLIRDGKQEEAIEKLNSLIHDYPRWPEAYYVKALAHRKASEVELSKNAVLNAIKLNPMVSKYHSLLAFYFLVERNFESAGNEAATALKQDGRNFQAAIILAKSRLFSKDYKGAEKIYQGIHKMVPDNIEVMLDLGLTYLALNNTDKAKEIFENVLAQQPGNEKAMDIIVRLEKQSGKTQEELIATVEKQIEKAPKSGGLYILLGNLYQTVKNFDKALESYDRGRDLAPMDPRPYALSASLLRRTGKTDQAIKKYQELITKRPDMVGAYMHLGILHEQQGNLETAKKMYSDALKLQSDFAPAANNLAWMITKEKDPDLGEALRLAMIAKEKMPDEANIIDTLGWVYFMRQSYGLARAEFMEAVQKEPDLPIIHYHLALALNGEGKKKEAVAELEEALKQGNEFEDRQQAEATLLKWKQE